MNWSAINWDAVLAIAQIVGDAGVFLSLVYVALQIRSDARARRADTMYRQSHAFMTSLHSLAFDSEFSDIFLRGGKSLASLSEAEQFRMTIFLVGQLRLWADAYFQFRQGNLDSDVWTSMLVGLRGVLASPGRRAVWQTQRSSFPSEFRTLLDNMSAEIEAAQPPPRVDGPATYPAASVTSPAAASTSATAATRGAAAHS